MSNSKKLVYLLLVLILAFGGLATSAFASNYDGPQTSAVETVKAFLFYQAADDLPTAIAGDCDYPNSPLC